MYGFDNSLIHGFRLEGGQYSKRSINVAAGRIIGSAPIQFALEAPTRKDVHPEGLGRHSFHQVSKAQAGRVVQGCANLYALLNGFGADITMADVTLRYSPNLERNTHMGVCLSLHGTENNTYEMYRVAVFIASTFQHIYNVGGAWFRYYQPQNETIFLGVNYAGFDLRYDQAWALRNGALIRRVISNALMQVVACSELSKDDVMDMFSEFCLRNLSLNSYHGFGQTRRWLPQGLVGAARSSEDYLLTSCCLSFGFKVGGDVVALPFQFVDLVRRHVNRKMNVLFEKGFYNANFAQRQTIRVGSPVTILDRLVELSVNYTLVVPLLSTIRVRYPAKIDKEFFKHFQVNVQTDRVSVFIAPSQEVEQWQRAVMLVNVILALYPETTIEAGILGGPVVPPVGSFLDPLFRHHVNTEFNMILDRAWYARAGFVSLHLPANVQGVMVHIYADRERDYYLNDMTRAVQDWLLSDITGRQ